MRKAALIIAVVLAGCASKAPVSFPVPTACVARADVPDAPTLTFGRRGGELADLYDEIGKLWHDRVLLTQYSQTLERLIQPCLQSHGEYRAPR